MPAKSKKQQRLFGMVHAYQKGELKNASEEVKDIANSISKKDAKDFAETKHKGLPNKVKKKKSVKISESRLSEIITESVHKVLSEANEFDNKIFDVMKEIEEEMVQIEEWHKKNEDVDDYNTYQYYCTLKRAYNALDELVKFSNEDY